uniref:Uncharacterized protein n=2 Tax=Anguilla anguilla TaxID=7936 RepID=A0A0E9QQF5_ANGAN
MGFSMAFCSELAILFKMLMLNCCSLARLLGYRIACSLEEAMQCSCL